MARTQIDKIIEYIDRNGSITQREAGYIGIQRLASRICEMNKSGTRVKTEMIKVQNADGSYSHVARYSWADTN